MSRVASCVALGVLPAAPAAPAYPVQVTPDHDPDLRRAASLDEELLEAETVDVETYLTDARRIERIDEELRTGFASLAHVGKAVSVFGSARTPPGHPEYEHAREAARRLGEAGFAMITGGGPGIMEAANRGAHEAGGKTVGLNIRLASEQGANPYISRGLNFEFHYFFMRKFWFAYLAKAVIIFPGGFGTLDELFEILTLEQTQKLAPRTTIVLYGTEYWDRVLSLQPMVDWGAIGPKDPGLMHRVDSVDAAFQVLKPALEAELAAEGETVKAPKLKLTRK